MMKEMTPSHRTNLLNDAVHQYCERKTAGFGKHENEQ
jgi:hypothetical protein